MAESSSTLVWRPEHSMVPGFMRRMVACLLGIGVVVGCGKNRSPVPLVAPPPARVVAQVPDAAVAMVAEPVPTPVPVADPDPGLQDDPPIDTEAVEGVALKKLLLRDPDRASKALEGLPMPNVWQISLIAQLALKHGDPGPDVVPEAPMPEVLPDEADRFVLAADTDAGTNSVAEAGVAYIANALMPLKASAKPRAPTVMMLPINTAVTVTKIDGPYATVTVEVATEVQFAQTGAMPIKSSGITKTGIVDAKWLVKKPMTAAELTALAATKKGSELHDDEAVELLYRAFLIDRTEAARAALVDGAWKAQRASWVITAAMAQLHVAPKRIDVAWACQGDLSKAKWQSMPKKLPAKWPDSVCVTNVDLRKPCKEDREPAWQERVDAVAKSGLTAGTVVQMVVDATRPRVLWFYTTDLNNHDVCASQKTYELDPYQARVRRLVLPLGTSKTIVRIDSASYDGVEFGVVAAPNEAKARGWLRKRAHYRWTIEHGGELGLSLGVADTDFEGEHNVSGVTYARAPAFDCEAGCEQ